MCQHTQQTKFRAIKKARYRIFSSLVFGTKWQKHVRTALKRRPVTEGGFVCQNPDFCDISFFATEMTHWWLWSPGWKRKLSCWRCHPCKLDTRVCVVWCLFLLNFQCSEKGPIKNLLSWHVRSRPPQLHYNAKPKPIKTHGYLYTYMENLGGQLYGWKTHSYGSKSRKAVASCSPDNGRWKFCLCAGALLIAWPPYLRTH